MLWKRWSEIRYVNVSTISQPLLRVQGLNSKNRMMEIREIEDHTVFNAKNQKALMTTSTSSKSSTHHKNHISEQNFSCLFILLSASLPTLATSYCWLHNFQQGWMKNLPILFKTRTIFLLLPADNTASSTFKIFKWKSRLRENARKQYWTKISRKFKLKPTPSNHHSTYITMLKEGTQHCSTMFTSFEQEAFSSSLIIVDSTDSKISERLPWNNGSQVDLERQELPKQHRNYQQPNRLYTLNIQLKLNLL
jgi:hypothetical protein